MFVCGHQLIRRLKDFKSHLIDMPIVVWLTDSNVYVVLLFNWQALIIGKLKQGVLYNKWI